ncbi:MAG: tRNA pseudouridine(13) synthase TruD, partial [bacterium]|nr:tRNA pseudouridine(13) synthase TruD [bacterium]
YHGTAGDYLFYKELPPDTLAYLKSLKIPTCSSKITVHDKKTEAVLQKIMDRTNIKPSLFNLREVRQAFFKSTDRAVLITPGRFSSAPADDERYEGKKKMFFEFDLPRGSYATMFIKRIFT